METSSSAPLDTRPAPSASPCVLHVDLTRETACRLPQAAADRTRDLGGRGLAWAALDGRIHLAWDDPEAGLAFFPGRLAGLDLPGAGRLTAAWISPLTGLVADAGFGGRLGAALARAGLAGVVVTGRAAGPRGLVLRDREQALVDASALAGLPTPDVFAALVSLDGALVAGPAAWTGCRLAGAVVDRWHGPSRGGLGLAMAAKNFLFMAATGHGAVPVADARGLRLAREAMARLVGASPALGPGGLGRFGSAALMDLTHGRRMMPTHHFRATYFPRAPQVNAPRLEAVLGPTLGLACPGCPVACHRLAPGGLPFPGHDALSHFTALLGLADPGLAVAAQAACLAQGIDPVSLAVAMAGRAEATGGDPRPATVMELIAATAAGQGPGRELGLGAAALARAAGRPEAAMCSKGLELPAFDPRGAYGLALGCAVSAVGPDPWRAGCLAHEVLRKPVATDRFTFDGKARAVFLGENATAALDSLGACPWLTLGTGLEEWGQAISAATGQPTSAGDLGRAGERLVFRERQINTRRGLTAADDDLPGRFFTEPGTGGGGIAVPPLDRQAFLAARAKYYRLRGLTADGLPDPERAAALGLA
jgi:aldehyde:ferredoxin oxidoreductase